MNSDCADKNAFRSDYLLSPHLIILLRENNLIVELSATYFFVLHYLHHSIFIYIHVLSGYLTAGQVYEIHGT